MRIINILIAFPILIVLILCNVSIAQVETTVSSSQATIKGITEPIIIKNVITPPIKGISSLSLPRDVKLKVLHVCLSDSFQVEEAGYIFYRLKLSSFTQDAISPYPPKDSKYIFPNDTTKTFIILKLKISGINNSDVWFGRDVKLICGDKEYKAQASFLKLESETSIGGGNKVEGDYFIFIVPRNSQLKQFKLLFTAGQEIKLSYFAEHD